MYPIRLTRIFRKTGLWVLGLGMLSCAIEAQPPGVTPDTRQAHSHGPDQDHDLQKYIPDYTKQMVPNDTHAGKTAVLSGSRTEKSGKDVSSVGVLRLFSQDIPSLVHAGPATLKEIKITQDAQIYGPLQFNHLEVAGELSVAGPLKGENGVFSTAKIEGLMDVEDVKVAKLIVRGLLKATRLRVTEKLEITGCLSAKGSQFQDIEAYTDKMTLKDSTVHDIVVKKGQMVFTKQPRVYLKGTSQVNGTITFEGMEGLVVIRGKTAAPQVKGGKVQQES